MAAAPNDMLEQPSLLLCPHDASPRRAIVDATSGTPLGSARRLPAARRPWWAQLGRAVLAVHEHEDDPLVFTVRRCWSLLPWHEVRDAEGRPVGYLLHGRVENCYGRRLAVLEREAGGAVFRGRGGDALARLSEDGAGLHVAFSPEVESDPFFKMLLLAAALTAPWPCRSG